MKIHLPPFEGNRFFKYFKEHFSFHKKDISGKPSNSIRPTLKSYNIPELHDDTDDVNIYPPVQDFWDESEEESREPLHIPIISDYYVLRTDYPLDVPDRIDSLQTYVFDDDFWGRDIGVVPTSYFSSSQLDDHGISHSEHFTIEEWVETMVSYFFGDDADGWIDCVKGLIMTECMNNPYVGSDAGAVGIMQIIGSTAVADVNSTSQFGKLDVDQLLSVDPSDAPWNTHALYRQSHPRYLPNRNIQSTGLDDSMFVNIYIGVAYLAICKNYVQHYVNQQCGFELNSNDIQERALLQTLSLIAYNSGIGYLQRIISSYSSTDRDTFVTDTLEALFQTYDEDDLTSRGSVVLKGTTSNPELTIPEETYKYYLVNFYYQTTYDIYRRENLLV
ncbi:transglycosylase SLT domain-containing protein [Candidatus Margulisiibacteriota bacterium]